MHMFPVELYKGQVILASPIKLVYVSQETRPKFIGSQNLNFYFHYKLFCIINYHNCALDYCP